jgi:hypothetical protein
MLRLSIVWRCPICNQLAHLLYTDVQPGTFGPTCTQLNAKVAELRRRFKL